MSGQENRCVDCLIAGVSVAGGLAELASAPWWTLVEVPAALSAIDAAAVALSGMTAWHMLHARSHLRAGDVVLVMSASSAVGSLAVQIARDAGARVIATTSTLKVDKVRALGVDVVIDYQREPVREAVLAATAGAGADVVLDHVGGASLGLGVRCAARGGRVLTCGATQPGAVSLDPWPLFAKEISVIGCIGAMRAETAELLDAVAAGRVRPVLACTYPLTEVLDAYATLRSEDRVGKVVVTVG